MERDEINGLTFEEWIAQINKLFESEFGLGYEDFPDWNYYDNWSDGMTPEETFADYLEEQGFPDL